VPRRFQRRPDADEHRDRSQHQRRRNHDWRVHADVLDARDVGRQRGHDRPDRPDSADDAEDAAEQEHRHQLRHRLGDEP
jgi:hypothetical protein